MVEKNPYEKQSNTDTVDIPSFMKEKTEGDSGDLSIFKMSDEELYDDIPETNGDQSDDEPVRRKGKKNASLLLSLLLIVLLLLTSIASLLYAMKQRDAYNKANANYLQLLANEEAYKKQLNEKDLQIEALNQQIEDMKHSSSDAAGTVYEVVDGPITFRSTPAGDATTYNGKSAAENGEKFKALESTKVTSDGVEYTWIKVADDVYFCIGSSSDIWARKAE